MKGSKVVSMIDTISPYMGTIPAHLETRDKGKNTVAMFFYDNSYIPREEAQANAILFTRSREMLALLRELAPTLGHYHGALGGCTACQVDALLEDLKEVEA